MMCVTTRTYDVVLYIPIKIFGVTIYKYKKEATFEAFNNNSNEKFNEIIKAFDIEIMEIIQE